MAFAMCLRVGVFSLVVAGVELGFDCLVAWLLGYFWFGIFVFRHVISSHMHVKHMWLLSFGLTWQPHGTRDGVKKSISWCVRLPMFVGIR